MTQMKTSFTNDTNLLRKGHRRLRRQFVSSIIIRIIREIRLNSLLKRKQDAKTMMMSTTSKQQCAAAPLPVRGGVRGGVSFPVHDIFLKNNEFRRMTRISRI